MRHVVAFTIRDSDRDELYWEELAVQKGADSWGMYLGDGLGDNDIAEIYLRFQRESPRRRSRPRSGNPVASARYLRLPRTLAGRLTHGCDRR